MVATRGAASRDPSLRVFTNYYASCSQIALRDNERKSHHSSCQHLTLFECQRSVEALRVSMQNTFVFCCEVLCCMLSNQKRIANPVA